MIVVSNYFLCRNGAMLRHLHDGDFIIEKAPDADSKYKNNYPNCLGRTIILVTKADGLIYLGGAHGDGWDAVHCAKTTAIAISKNSIIVAALVLGALLAWWIL